MCLVTFELSNTKDNKESLFIEVFSSNWKSIQLLKKIHQNEINFFGRFPIKVTGKLDNFLAHQNSIKLRNQFF
jgi:hypothetical protein